MWCETNGAASIRTAELAPFPAPSGNNCGDAGIYRIVIEDTVAQVFNIRKQDLNQSSRGRAQIALARQVAMYLAHTGLGITMKNTGMLFGRDRSTVAHACGVVEDQRDDPHFDRILELLEWVILTRLSSSRVGKMRRV